MWMLLYFGTFGSAGTVLFVLAIWNGIKVHRLAGEALRSAAKWNMIGYAFLFLGALSACGIGAPPGSLLLPDPTIHNVGVATTAAVLSMFFSVPGWACVLVGTRKMIKATK